jgi:hypothetical protein
VVLYLVLPGRTEVKDLGRTFGHQWTQHTRGLAPDVKEALHSYVVRMRSLVIKHIVYGSPVLVLLLSVTFVAVIEAVARTSV